MNRICTHLRQYAGIETIDSDGYVISCLEEPEAYYCGWHEHDLPPPLMRYAMCPVEEGECEVCPHYEAPAVTIPGVKVGHGT